MPAKSSGGSRARDRRSPNAATAAASPRELRARGQRTQRRLLDAAVAVFADRGYHAARVDDIVKAAKTSHGTFYLYFANKEELFTALAAEVAEQMRSLAGDLPEIGPGRDGERALRDWLERFTELYERYAPVVRAWTEAEIAQDGVGRIGEELLAEFSAALAARVAETQDADVYAPVAGTALLAMIERLNYYVITDQLSLPRDAMLDALARVTHAAMFGTRRARSAR